MPTTVAPEAGRSSLRQRATLLIRASSGAAAGRAVAHDAPSSDRRGRTWPGPFHQFGLLGQAMVYARFTVANLHWSWLVALLLNAIVAPVHVVESSANASALTVITAPVRV